jgi:hypothetical protein
MYYCMRLLTRVFIKGLYRLEFPGPVPDQHRETTVHQVVYQVFPHPHVDLVEVT